MGTLRINQFYKTKTCPWFSKGKCERGIECRFAHSETEKRILPDLSKTSLCSAFLKTGVCNDSSCRFAHEVDQLRATNNIYKTSLCYMFMKSKCKAGSRCRHAHGIHELRPSTSSNQTLEYLSTQTSTDASSWSRCVGTIKNNVHAPSTPSVREPKETTRRKSKKNCTNVETLVPMQRAHSHSAPNSHNTNYPKQFLTSTNEPEDDVDINTLFILQANAVSFDTLPEYSTHHKAIDRFTQVFRCHSESMQTTLQQSSRSSGRSNAACLSNPFFTSCAHSECNSENFKSYAIEDSGSYGDPMILASKHADDNISASTRTSMMSSLKPSTLTPTEIRENLRRQSTMKSKKNISKHTLLPFTGDSVDSWAHSSPPLSSVWQSRSNGMSVETIPSEDIADGVVNFQDDTLLDLLNLHIGSDSTIGQMIGHPVHVSPNEFTSAKETVHRAKATKHLSSHETVTPGVKVSETSSLFEMIQSRTSESTDGAADTPVTFTFSPYPSVGTLSSALGNDNCADCPMQHGRRRNTELCNQHDKNAGSLVATHDKTYESFFQNIQTMQGNSCEGFLSNFLMSPVPFNEGSYISYEPDDLVESTKHPSPPMKTLPAKIVSYDAASVERNFVAAPSQLFHSPLDVAGIDAYSFKLLLKNESETTAPSTTTTTPTQHSRHKYPNIGEDPLRFVHDYPSVGEGDLWEGTRDKTSVAPFTSMSEETHPFLGETGIAKCYGGISSEAAPLAKGGPFDGLKPITFLPHKSAHTSPVWLQGEAAVASMCSPNEACWTVASPMQSSDT